MVYVSDVMQKKVKAWIAILVILLLTIFAAWAISARAAAGLTKSGSNRLTKYSRTAYTLFFGGVVEAATPCPCPTGGCELLPSCGCGSTLIKFKSGTYGNGFPLVCQRPNTPFIGPPPVPGINILGFGPQLFPILFYTSR